MSLVPRLRERLLDGVVNFPGRITAIAYPYFFDCAFASDEDGHGDAANAVFGRYCPALIHECRKGVLIVPGRLTGTQLVVF